MLACVKNNLAEDRGGLAYELSGHPACVVWLGESKATADELLGGKGRPGRPSKALEAGKRFLQQVLGQGQRVPVKDLEAMAEEAGVAKRTLDRAREELSVQSEPSGFGKHWVCFLPETPPVSPILGVLADTVKTDDLSGETAQGTPVSPVSAKSPGMGNTAAADGRR